MNTHVQSVLWSRLCACLVLAIALGLALTGALRATPAASATPAPLRRAIGSSDGVVRQQAGADVGISKWHISGHVRPGGKLVYGLVYFNNGDTAATDVRVVDTLPPSTGYAADTSGLTPDIDAGGTITWHIGDLPAYGEAGNWGVFAITLDVDSGVVTGTEAIAGNCATVTTTAADGNPANDTSCTNPVDVWESDVGIDIGTWPAPGDPARGEEFDYTLRWCSETGADFGPVWLTDTLPVSTTLVGWEAIEWPAQALWTEVVTTEGQLALYAPALPGNWCQHIILRLALDPDAPLGMPLDNHVVVTTPGDIHPENNVQLDQQATASAPRPDLALNKYVHRGVLAPGGWINYLVRYENQGNIALAATLTDTLPTGLAFEGAAWGGDQPDADEPFPPTAIIGNQLIWELDAVPVNGARWFHIQASITDTLQAGDVLTNCARIGAATPDAGPDDNAACATVRLNPTGPNLQVYKEHGWNDQSQLGYQVYVNNLGDEPISDIWVTDTLPADTQWDGWWNLQELPQDRISETALSGETLAWHISELQPGEGGVLAFNANLDDPGPLQWFTNTVVITSPTIADVKPADNAWTDVAFSGGEVDWVNLDVYRSHIQGCASVMPINITTAEAETTITSDFCWDEQDFGDTFDPGDVITITAGTGRQPVVITVPAPFTGRISSITDTVWGQIDALDHESVRVELWGMPTQVVETDSQGRYAADYADIPHSAQGDVAYHTQVNYAEVGFFHRLTNPDLTITVDTGDNGVDADYAAGHTGWVTIADSVHAIKATVEVTTAAWPWWDGRSGFSTHHHTWQPAQPDIQPGDWVTATLDNGYGTVLQVGTIDAGLNTETDIVSGTINVPRVSAGLTVRCEIHEPGAPAIEVHNVAPSDGHFVCDFSGQWDIIPGQQVVVIYVQPDRNQVMARLANPAPHLQVEKRLEGGEVGEDGNALFYIQYRNVGDGAATDVVITDTLEGMAYLTDTLGLPHTGSGGQVTWDLGTVAADSQGEFYVFAEVTAAADAAVTNTVEIATGDPFDQGEAGEKRHDWSGTVIANDAFLNVGKWAWTNDPAPGQDVVFTVNVCNQGPTASAAVIVTDTLPSALRLDTWWSQETGWAEVRSDDHSLVLTRPAVAGGRCNELYVRATVDGSATPGTPISNTVEIFAPNDLSSDDNTATWQGQVSPPYTNLAVDKGWGNGQLVPGGELHYWITVHNNGNQPVGAFTLTDTLPAATSLQAIWRHDQSGPTPVALAYTDTQRVAWDVSGLDNGFGIDYEVILDVAADAAPGTVLVNAAEVTCLPDEDNCEDNAASSTETLFDHGPNLRLRKQGAWDNWGAETRRASYQLQIENVGDQVVQRVTVTDTLPLGMALDGGVGSNFWEWWDWSDQGDHLTITLTRLEPAWSVGFDFGLITDTAPLPFGLVFTNTAEIDLIDADTHPDDNSAVAVLTTGPDLWVEKALVDGDLRPGELITFALRFGNAHQGHEWWWHTQGDVWLTDTLPSGFEFITATRRSTGWAPFTPDLDDGTQLAWNTGNMPAGGEDELRVTLRVPATATGLDTFTNTAEVASSAPVSDTEPLYTNNASSMALPIDLPYLTLRKTYESTHIAGTPVTYTLTVTNTGNSLATGVVLTDTVPDGVTYDGGDGAHTAGLITWTLDDLAAAGDTETGWFRGLLPCATGSVTNAAYGVNSAEGVTATGSPVTLDVQAPALVAAFDQSATGIVAGSLITFTDRSTTNGPAIATWAWDFGDDATSSEPDPEHTYTAAGTFTVALTVTDTCGYTAVATSTVTVTPDCTPLTAATFAISPAEPVVNAPVTFTATYTPTAATAPITYTWAFGDGATATRNTATIDHTYTAADDYDVTLTVYNPCTPAGVQATAAVAIALHEVYLPLVLR